MRRPVFHATPPSCWMNDPNGLIYFHGRYHMFYQHFPYGNQWGTMHWGHLSSPDLVSWVSHGIALFPTKWYDQNGCFSGSAIEAGGKLYLYYTGVQYVLPDPENIHALLNDEVVSRQIMISSEDGFAFDNFSGKQLILDRMDDISFASYNRTRDPRVWKHGNQYLMSLGTQYLDDKGRMTGAMLLYKSEDAVCWKYANRFSDRHAGNSWECPVLFETGGRWLLIVSAMHTAVGNGYTDHALIRMVDLDPCTCTISSAGEISRVDEGGDLYAPHVFADADGVPTMIGWLRMETPFPGESWIGMMSLPRHVSWKNGQVCYQVIPALQQRFSKQIPSQQWNGSIPCRIKADIPQGGCIDLGCYTIQANRETIIFKRSVTGKAVKETVLPRTGTSTQLDIYLDFGIIETYVDNGRQVVSHVLYQPYSAQISFSGIDQFQIYIE